MNISKEMGVKCSIISLKRKAEGPGETIMARRDRGAETPIGKDSSDIPRRKSLKN